MNDVLAIAPALLNWFDQHGRTDLPWQSNRTPYRVWISEIMLQQTQVATVIPYFERFTGELPDIEALATADDDVVLHLWSGLGYYRRARNLHTAAKIIRDQHAGRMPKDIDGLMALPGIGRSTAGAILALSLNQRHPILDGNVKRVLARVHTIDGWPGKSAVANSLWELAEHHTPVDRIADYTQAIMDLGATLCTRNNPLCKECPLRENCLAQQAQSTAQYPGRKPARKQPVRKTVFIIVINDRQQILLLKRPPTGIWGGLWSFPECGSENDISGWCESHLSSQLGRLKTLPALRHTFTHFHLDITPVLISLNADSSAVRDTDTEMWWHTGSPPVGLPAPVQKLLNSLSDHAENRASASDHQVSTEYA